MKRIEDRICELETATVEKKEHRLLHISEGEDAEAVIARDRKATGFTGDYRVIIYVGGRWQDFEDGMHWVRPDGTVDPTRFFPRSQPRPEG